MPNYYNPSGTQALDFASPVNAFIQSFQLARDRKEGKKKEQLAVLLAPIQKELEDETTSFDKKKELIALLPSVYKSVGLNNKGMEEGFNKLIEYYDHANNSYLGTGENKKQDVVTVRPDPNSPDGGIIDDSITQANVPEYKRRGDLSPQDLKLIFQKKLLGMQSGEETASLERKLQLENTYKQKFLKEEGFDRSPEKVLDEKGQLWEVWTNPRNDTPARFVPLGNYTDKIPSGKTITETMYNTKTRAGKVGAKHYQIVQTAMSELGLDPNRALTSEEDEKLAAKVQELYKLDFDNTQTLKTSGVKRNETSVKVGEGTLAGTIPPSREQTIDDKRAEQKRIEDYSVQLSTNQGEIDGLENSISDLTRKIIDAAGELKRLQDEGYENEDKEMKSAQKTMDDLQEELRKSQKTLKTKEGTRDAIKKILDNPSTNSSANPTTNSYSPAETAAIAKFRENNKNNPRAQGLTDEQILEIVNAAKKARSK